MVARVALPEPRPLQFKDNVYLRDRISTGERSIVRVLLGGKATVTARERSVLTITESPGVATIDLSAGRISVAVSKGLMKRGEVVDIHIGEDPVGRGYEFTRDQTAPLDGRERSWIERVQVIRSDSSAEAQARALQRRLEKAEGVINVIAERILGLPR